MRNRNWDHRLTVILSWLAAATLALLTMFACSGSQVTPEPTVPSEASPTFISTNQLKDSALPAKERELYDAIWESSVSSDELRALITQGNQVNANDEDGDPFLYTAIWRADPEKVQVLVDAGADVNAKDSSGEPMLYTAIWRDKIEALKILVNSGADVNARDSDDDPLLYTAVWQDKQEALKILIDAGADVNARRANGESLLYVARWRGKTEIEQILLDAGATE